MSAPDAALRTLMLVEPQSLLRSTVAMVARQLKLARVKDLVSIASAEQTIAGDPVDALLIALDDDGAALAWLANVRAGNTAIGRHVPIAVMASSCDKALALRLRELDARRILLKPFKVRSVIEVIVSFCCPPAGAPDRPGSASDPDETFDLDDGIGARPLAFAAGTR